MIQEAYYINTINISIEEISTTMDTIVNEEFNRYQIINFADTEKLYITDEMQLKMIQDIFRSTYTSLSPTIISRWQTVYTRDHIEDMLAQRVQHLVLNFCIEVNGNYKK